MRTTDNSRCDIIPKEKADLEYIASQSISELQTDNDTDVLIFSYDSTSYNSIKNEHILSLQDGQAVTGNIMGFVGYKDTALTIHSRFAKDEQHDYFLHYMLQQVFAINIFDLDAPMTDEPIFDFLVFMFPYFLKKALRQGLYKEYQQHLYNDTHIKGRIDVNRHIRRNIPFAGKVAYDTREFSHDNHVTQLIRHTIEYIKQLPYHQYILDNEMETKENVRQIVSITPTYQRNNRRQVIHENIKPLRHPYFYEYADLQRICMRILLHEEIKYGHDDKIHGILFDGAWLWEEYLAKVLSPGFVHYKKGFPLLKDREGTFRSVIPDFLSQDRTIVADAKYIPLEKRYRNLSLDSAAAIYYKTIMYMYRFQSNQGLLIYPNPNETSIIPLEICETNGRLHLIGMKIPVADTYKEFVEEIRIEENKICKI